MVIVFFIYIIMFFYEIFIGGHGIFSYYDIFSGHDIFSSHVIFSFYGNFIGQGFMCLWYICLFMVILVVMEFALVMGFL